MKFPIVLSTAVLGFASLASAITVSYDAGYDDGSRPLASVTCSDGRNGLITKYNWNEQGDIPVFPMIGGYQGITKWNSSTCGTCYSLTYNGESIYVLAIDFAANGFNIAKEAMDVLTLGNSETLGRINAQYVQVNVTKCKIGSELD